MVGREPEHEAARECIIGARTPRRPDSRRSRRASAIASAVSRYGTTVATGPKASTSMDCARGMRRAAQQQQRRHERAALAIGAAHFEVLQPARDEIALAAQFSEAREHIGALLQAHQRPHAHALRARIADDDRAQGRLQGADHIVAKFGRHQRLADGRALLARP